MKKNILDILILLVIVLSLVACNSNISTTDLSSIKIDNIKVGDSIIDVDLDRFTTSDRFQSKENTLNFEEIKIETNEDNIITQINANNKDVKLLINGVEGFNSIEGVTNMLGENFKNSWYDKEQKLKENKYFDLEKNIEVSFVYDDNGKNLVWIILGKKN